MNNQTWREAPTGIAVALALGLRIYSVYRRSKNTPKPLHSLTWLGAFRSVFRPGCECNRLLTTANRFVRRFPTMFDFSRCKPNTRKSLGTFILIATLLFSFATAVASPDKEKHSSVRKG